VASVTGSIPALAWPHPSGLNSVPAWPAQPSLLVAYVCSLGSAGSCQPLQLAQRHGPIYISCAVPLHGIGDGAIAVISADVAVLMLQAWALPIPHSVVPLRYGAALFTSSSISHYTHSVLLPRVITSVIGAVTSFDFICLILSSFIFICGISSFDAFLLSSIVVHIVDTFVLFDHSTHTSALHSFISAHSSHLTCCILFHLCCCCCHSFPHSFVSVHDLSLRSMRTFVTSIPLYGIRCFSFVTSRSHLSFTSCYV